MLSKHHAFRLYRATQIFFFVFAKCKVTLRVSFSYALTTHQGNLPLSYVREVRQTIKLFCITFVIEVTKQLKWIFAAKFSFRNRGERVNSIYWHSHHADRRKCLILIHWIEFTLFLEIATQQGPYTTHFCKL